MRSDVRIRTVRNAWSANRQINVRTRETSDITEHHDPLDHRILGPETFVWVDGVLVDQSEEEPRSRWLVLAPVDIDHLPAGVDPWVQPFRDSKYEGLFHRFAELERPLTEQAVLKFANAYGRFGEGIRERIIPFSIPAPTTGGVTVWYDDDGPVSPPPAPLRIEAWGESLSAWEAEADKLADVIGVWDDANPEENPNALVEVPELNQRMSVRHWVEWQISTQLERHVVAGLTLQRRSTPARLSFHPKGLLGSMWLQFAQEVSGNRRYGVCEADQCPNWFEVRRSDRRFCSNSCKARSNRRSTAQKSGGEG